MKKVVLLILLFFNFSLYSQEVKSDEGKERIVESRFNKIEQRKYVLNKIYFLELKKVELSEHTELSINDYKI